MPRSRSSLGTWKGDVMGPGQSVAEHWLEKAERERDRAREEVATLRAENAALLQERDEARDMARDAVIKAALAWTDDSVAARALRALMAARKQKN
jgi:hypothetical protein